MSGNARVLIVDQDEKTSGMLSAALMGAGMDVILAKDGPEAAAKLANETFYFILVDFEAPRVNESAVLEALGKSVTRNGSYLIISSPKIDPAIDEKFQKLPRVRHLPKPIGIKDLLKLVKEFSQDAAKVQGTPSTLDVKVINPIISSAMKKVSPAFVPALQVNKPYLRKEAEVSGDISVVVGMVSSGFKGSVALSFGRASYLKLISSTLGTPLTEIDDDVRDAIVEVAREILDGAQEQYRSQNLSVVITNPSVICSDGHSLQHSSKKPPVVLVFRNESSDGFRIEISIQ